MYGPVHPATAQKAVVGGIDNGIDIKGCDVCLNDFEFFGIELLIITQRLIFFFLIILHHIFHMISRHSVLNATGRMTFFTTVTISLLGNVIAKAKQLQKGQHNNRIANDLAQTLTATLFTADINEHIQPHGQSDQCQRKGTVIITIHGISFYIKLVFSFFDLVDNHGINTILVKGVADNRDPCLDVIE